MAMLGKLMGRMAQCGCGRWNAPGETCACKTVSTYPCHVKGCPERGIYRFDGKNSCKEHYLADVTASARRECEAMGLKTASDKRRFCIEKLRGILPGKFNSQGESK